NHVGGHLKIAPEHISPGVVKVMKKPGKEMFVRFKELFEKYSAEAGKEQYLVPYFISGHPGCEVKDMVELSDYLAENGWRPQQVQDLTPTPMTLATDMYYSGFHPNTGKPVHIPKDADEKAMQRALLQPHLPQYRGRAPSPCLALHPRRGRDRRYGPCPCAPWHLWPGGRRPSFFRRSSLLPCAASRRRSCVAAVAPPARAPAPSRPVLPSVQGWVRRPGSVRRTVRPHPVWG